MDKVALCECGCGTPTPIASRTDSRAERGVPAKLMMDANDIFKKLSEVRDDLKGIREVMQIGLELS